METQTAPHRARVLGYAALKSRLTASYTPEGLRKPLVTQRRALGRPPQPGQHPRLGIWVMPSTKCYLEEEEEGLEVCQRKVVFSGAAARQMKRRASQRSDDADVSFGKRARSVLAPSPAR